VLLRRAEPAFSTRHLTDSEAGSVIPRTTSRGFCAKPKARRSSSPATA